MIKLGMWTILVRAEGLVLFLVGAIRAKGVCDLLLDFWPSLVLSHVLWSFPWKAMECSSIEFC